ncbi:putative MATE family efflux protein [Kineothrix alysoides]|uniref:Probable multidrug resistance protein NorM n=1 Tax=Kineothrix alysoides TaxID=1469948 RepID=A0A4R1QZU7_9FIRM|nr:MATE family efflux transporter [Kineothrix alysoides]TCL58528.1 putative MATE family efflux protein [Kineothrix alysoides]
MKRYIGDKKFYMMVLAVAIPIMIQNGITNFVSLLDNIMVGRVGTEQMSGVAIVNQLIFVFNICIFGGVSGAGIFTAQFFGSGDHKGVRDTFRVKVLISVGITIIGLAVFSLYGERLIGLYLHETNDSEAISATLMYAKQYLRIMMLEMMPFAFVQAYASTLRETGETVIPMKAGIAAVFVNLVLNYILIYGKFGAPALGVEGAAIATTIARFVEFGIIAGWTYKHREVHRFIEGAYRSFHIPAHLIGKVAILGTPLMVNEILWASGQAVLTQCYSVRGLSVVAAFNISSTISNVFNVVFIAMGSSVGIIVGQLLGAGKMEEAKETDRKLIFFSVASCVGIGLLMSLVAPFFPVIYNTTTEIRQLASRFIMIAALCMPLYAFTHATYFTLRSGGKTWITFFFDSVYVWVVNIPLAFVLTRYTGIYIIVLYLFCQLIDIIKCIIGFVLVKKGVWIQKIIEVEK